MESVKVIKALVISLLLLLFSSCELISLFQLYPESVTRINGKGIDLSEIFGVYELHNEGGGFQMRYVENLNHRYLAIDCHQSGKDKPQSIVIDVDKWKVIREYDYHLDVRTLHKSTLLSTASENEIISFKHRWDENFVVSSLSSTIYISNDIFYYDSGDSQLKTLRDDNFDSINMIDPFSGNMAYDNDGSWSSGSVNISFYATDKIRVIKTTSQDNFNYLIGYYQGSGEVLAYRGNFGSDTFPVTPVSLGYTDYYQEENNNTFEQMAYYYGTAYITSIGWVKLAPGEVLPQFLIYDITTGNRLDKPSIPSGLIAAVDFAMDGKEYYYIDKNSIKLFKASTGW